MKKIVFLSLLNLIMNFSFSQTACDGLYFEPHTSKSQECGGALQVYVNFNMPVDSAIITFEYFYENSSNSKIVKEIIVNSSEIYVDHSIWVGNEIEIKFTVTNILLKGQKCSDTLQRYFGYGFMNFKSTVKTEEIGDFVNNKQYIVEILASIFQGNRDSTVFNGQLDIFEQQHEYLITDEKISTINFVNGKGSFITDKPGFYYLENPVCSYSKNYIMVKDEVYGRIIGKTAFDLNNSCRYEKNIDQLLPFQQISVNDGAYLLNSNKDGVFDAVLPYGTYKLKPIVDTNIVTACNDEIELTISKTSVQKDFTFLNRLKNFHDQKIQLSGSRPRPGFEFYYKLDYQNKSTFTEKSTIKFIHDTKVDLISSTDTNYIISGDTLIWTKNLNSNTTGDIRLVFKVPENVNLLGDTIFTEAHISSDSADVYLADNRSMSRLIIVGSYDPNDISLTTEPYNNTSNIQLEDTVLNYVIHFENEGTAEATNIKIINDLPEYLNASTTKIIAKSHDMYWNVIGNSLEFHFEDINLVSKNDSKLESQGFIEYSIKQKKTNELGNVIKNQANIYFDFNPAISTNQTSNSIGESVGLNKKQTLNKVNVYPNPFDNSFTIDKLTSGTIQIFDIKGNLLEEEQVDESSNFGLNLTQGVYIIKIYNQEEILFQKVIKL